MDQESHTKIRNAHTSAASNEDKLDRDDVSFQTSESMKRGKDNTLGDANDKEERTKLQPEGGKVSALAQLLMELRQKKKEE